MQTAVGLVQVPAPSSEDSASRILQTLVVLGHGFDLFFISTMLQNSLLPMIPGAERYLLHETHRNAEFPFCLLTTMRGLKSTFRENGLEASQLRRDPPRHVTLDQMVLGPCP